MIDQRYLSSPIVPGPWHWETDYDGSEHTLYDENGNTVLAPCNDGSLALAGHGVAVLIAKAPEMLALLREPDRWSCGRTDRPVCHATTALAPCWAHRVSALLDRIAKAGAPTPEGKP